MKRHIEVERISADANGNTWRAALSLPKIDELDWRHVQGIQGAMTEEGAWVEGFGYSPEGAIAAAYAVIGRAIMGLAHPSDLQGGKS